MKLNKKGFTLIELLAVVVILLAISVMAISSISAAIERNKATQDERKKEMIISIAKVYYEDHRNSLGLTGCIPISNLELSEDEMTDSHGDLFTGYIQYSNGSNFTYVLECS